MSRHDQAAVALIFAPLWLPALLVIAVVLAPLVFAGRFRP
jgi:hypothetical protein